MNDRDSEEHFMMDRPPQTASSLSGSIHSQLSSKTLAADAGAAASPDNAKMGLFAKDSQHGSGNRKTATLGAALDNKLLAYVAAASAAGVGLLALSQPAEAKIIYTHANMNILPHDRILLDLNHDGIADFTFKDFRNTNSFGSGSGRLSVLPAQKTNGIGGHNVSGQAYASALLPGVRIGPKRNFFSRTGMMAYSEDGMGPGKQHHTSGVCTGPWANVSNRYLGLKFVIRGETHFGWARLTVSCPYASSAVTATLTGYAYETVPNRPIVTGKKTGLEQAPRIAKRTRSGAGSAAFQPATLGRLAQGADGLEAWRREQE
jgi:hypothetical protein